MTEKKQVRYITKLQLVLFAKFMLYCEKQIFISIVEMEEANQVYNLKETLLTYNCMKTQRYYGPSHHLVMKSLHR